MSEKSGFSDSTSREVTRTEGETPFHSDLGKPAPVGDRIESRLQTLSPDRPVVMADNLSKVDPAHREILRNALEQTVDQCSKVSSPLRQAFNTAQRDGSENSKKWADTHCQKVLGVLCDNMAHVNNDVPVRVAMPIQSFVPGPNGQLKGETLYAFFPPLQTDIHQPYITFPLHSPDPQREAQLRKNDSMAASCSYEEFLFNCKRDHGGQSLLPKKERYN